MLRLSRTTTDRAKANSEAAAPAPAIDQIPHMTDDPVVLKMVENLTQLQGHARDVESEISRFNSVAAEAAAARTRRQTQSASLVVGYDGTGPTQTAMDRTSAQSLAEEFRGLCERRTAIASAIRQQEDLISRRRNDFARVKAAAINLIIRPLLLDNIDAARKFHSLNLKLRELFLAIHERGFSPYVPRADFWPMVTPLESDPFLHFCTQAEKALAEADQITARIAAEDSSVN